MRNVSSDFKAELAADRRAYLESVEFTLADGTTTVSITNEHLWSNGFIIEDSVSSGDKFQVGSAVINKATLVLNNIYEDFDEYDFFNATAVIKVGLELPDETVEEVTFGKYTVVNQPEYNGSLITVELYDNMVEFDRPYSESTLVYPATLDTIVRDACTVASTLSGKNIILATTSFPNKDFVVSFRPDDENITIREVIAYAAQIAGCYARMDGNGYLALKWYDQDALEEAVEDDDVPGVHYFSGFYEKKFSIDDVVITGVRVSMDVEREVTVGTGSEAHTETVYEKEEYLYGTDGYVISIENNPLIDELQVQTVATYLGTRINGFSFRTADISHGSDPTIEAGDVAVCIDPKGNRYGIVVSQTRFSVGDAQHTQSNAEDPVRNSSARYSVETKNYVEARKRIAQEKTARELAIDDLSERIDNAQGLFETQVQQTGGGVITYLHNKPLLAESDIQIKVSTVGVTVTANGTASSPTWYGLTVDGQLIASILNTSGINADWINTGQFVITKDGAQVFFADVDTGTVRIAGNSVVISAGDALDTAISSASGYTLETPITWSNNNNMATFNAIVYKGVEDVTSDFNPDWFVWTLRTEDGESQVGTGKTLSLTKSQFGYGATITCTFTTYDNISALRSVDGQNLHSVDDRQFQLYTNLQDSDVLVSDLPVKTASQVDPYDYLMGIDNVEGYQVSITNFFDYLVTTHTSTIGGTTTTVKNAIESRVSKSGDTMTGTLNLRGNSYAELTFETLDGGALSRFRAYADSSQTSYGNVIMLNAGGNLILGGGESAQNIYNNNVESVQGTGENTVLAADGTIIFLSNCNAIAERHRMAFQSDGRLLVEDGSYMAKNTAIDSKIGQTVPLSNTNLGYFAVQDNQSYSIFWMQAYKDSNDRLQGQLGFRRKNAAGTAINHFLNLYIDASGIRTVGVSDAAAWRAGLGAVNIAGDTMTGNLTISKTTPYIRQDSTDLDCKIGQTIPESNRRFAGWYSYDKNGSQCFYSETIKSTTDSVYQSFVVRRLNTSGTAIVNGFYLHVNSSGNAVVSFAGDGKTAWLNGLGLNNTVSVNNISSKNVATETNVTMGNTGSLAAGTYIIIYRVSFAANTTGRRCMYLTTSTSSTSPALYSRIQQAPSPNATTELIGTAIATITSATTYYLRAYHQAGSTLACTGQLHVLKIHD